MKNRLIIFSEHLVTLLFSFFFDPGFIATIKLYLRRTLVLFINMQQVKPAQKADEVTQSL
ncbi:MAG: hypothetical protein JWQ96_1394 [Segetibacter sp.]|jgi:hypothetical protein|nr:hypothetical protein [Segetibacter sp.]